MNRNLKTLALALFTWALGEGLFMYLVPLYLGELGASAEQIGTLIGLGLLARVVTMLPAGFAADRLGVHRVMVGGWLTGLAAAMVMAAASGIRLFAAGWIMYGLSGWVVPALTSYVIRERGTLKPERALTWVFSAFSAGLVISPLLGGLIGEHFGLRASFVVAVGLFGISNLVMLLRRAQPAGFKVPDYSDASLLRNRRFMVLMGVVFVAMFALWLGIPLAPIYLQERWGARVSEVGLLGSAASLGEVVLALFLGSRPPRRAFIVLQAAGLVYLLILLSTGQTGWLALGFFFRAGALVSRQFIDAISARVVAPSQLGLAFAISATVSSVAGVVSAASAGHLYAVRAHLPFQFGLLLIPLAIALTHRFAPRPGDPEAGAGQ
jgi:predicted MFS family arabinose efflux permease